MVNNRINWILLISICIAFSICSVYLISNKTPWVDETYSWYGINHESFDEFASSITSGINYSPPLYFFINWIGQLFLSLTLDDLRFESLVFIIGGSYLIYCMLLKLLGPIPALLGAGGILLQSDLLLEQSTEARQYGLFFFCGAAVLFAGKNLLTDNRKRTTWVWAFIANLALCLTHYLGIIFSGLAGLSRFWAMGFDRKKAIKSSPEIASWIVSIVVYAFLIKSQTSHLNTWNKANGLGNLISSYLDTFNPLFFLIPIVATIYLNLRSKIDTSSINSQNLARKFIFYCSILWICIPLLIWFLSLVSPLNLFKNRYFIPKEAAWMVLIGIIMTHFFNFRNNSKKILAPVIVSLILGVGMLAISTKRKIFAYHPSHNYHNWLIAKDELIEEEIPIIFTGDPTFFPNSYIHPNQSYFLIDEKKNNLLYKKFSKAIQIIDSKQLKNFNEFLLVSEELKSSQLLSKDFILERSEPFHDLLPLFAHRFLSRPR